MPRPRQSERQCCRLHAACVIAHHRNRSTIKYRTEHSRAARRCMACPRRCTGGILASDISSGTTTDANRSALPLPERAKPWLALAGNYPPLAAQVRAACAYGCTICELSGRGCGRLSLSAIFAGSARANERFAHPARNAALGAVTNANDGLQRRDLPNAGAIRSGGHRA
jgi:hypothetical protein